MARREIVEAKKEKALSRVARFRDDYASLRKQYDRVKSNGATQKATADRDALLSSSSSAVSHGYTSSTASRPPHRIVPGGTPHIGESPFSSTGMQNNNNGYGGSANNNGQDRYQLNSPLMESGGGGGGFAGSVHDNPRTNFALRENDFMASTSATLDSYIQQGQAVLGNLATQKDVLKGTKRRLISAANTLGLSRTTIQYIERRTKGDFYILLGGGTFTLVCFYLILKYFG